MASHRVPGLRFLPGGHCAHRPSSPVILTTREEFRCIERQRWDGNRNKQLQCYLETRRCVSERLLVCPPAGAWLEQLLTARLSCEKGATSQTWQRTLGKVIVRDAKTLAHCNWDVRLSGTDTQRAVIERLLDDIRLEHSIVAARRATKGSKRPFLASHGIVLNSR